MPMRATNANKVKSKVPPSRLQVYLGHAEVGAALEREAKVHRISLSQAAALMIERGLKSRISADPNDRLLILERRLSDHMRLSARDFVIIEEMLYVSMRMMLSRFPENEAERSGPYRASVETGLQAMMGDVAERVRRTSSGKMTQSLKTQTPGAPANDLTGDLPGDEGLASVWINEV